MTKIKTHKVEVTYMNKEMYPTTTTTFVNVIKISEAKNNLILYFKDGSKQKISNDDWFMYEQLN